MALVAIASDVSLQSEASDDNLAGSSTGDVTMAQPLLAQWEGDFGQAYAEAILSKPLNNTTLNLIAKGYKAMPPVERERVRALRAKRGICCPDCGLRGYYRVNCTRCPSLEYDRITDEFVSPDEAHRRKLQRRMAEEERRKRQEEENERDRLEEATKEAVVKSTTGQGTWLWAGKANPARRHHSSISTVAEGGALTRGDAAAQPAPLKPGSKGGSGVKFSPEEHGLKAWVDYVPSLSSGSSRTGSLTSASDHSANLDSFSLGSTLSGSRPASVESLEGYTKPQGASWYPAYPELGSAADDEHSILSLETATNPSREVRAQLTVEADANRSFNNLQLTLTRLIGVLRTQLGNVVPDFAPSMCCPPPNKLKETFYPQSLWKQYADYFTRAEKERPEKRIHAHKYMGSYRIPDRIAHPFDRVPLTTKRRVEVEKQMYEPDPEAGRRNVHQPVDWRQLNGEYDKYAPSGRGANAAIERIKKAFKNQAVWVEKQAKNMEQQHDRALHLLHVLREELATEEKRQLEWTELDGPQQLKRWGEMVKERAESADKIMSVLEDYKFITNGEVAAYFIYVLDNIRKAGVKEARWSYFSSAKGSVRNKKRPSPGRVRQAMTTSALGIATRTVSGLGKTAALGKTSGDRTMRSTQGLGMTVTTRNALDQTSAVPGDDFGNTMFDATTVMSELSATSAMGLAKGAMTLRGGKRQEMAADDTPPPKPSPRIPQGMPRPDTAEIRQPGKRKIKKKVLPGPAGFQSVKHAIKCFKIGRLHIRTGQYTDTTQIPAIVPLPKAYSVVGGDSCSMASATSNASVDVQETASYEAAKIMQQIRNRHIDKVTGKQIDEQVRALWHRVTDADGHSDSRKYTFLLGHPLAHVGSTTSSDSLKSSGTSRANSDPMERRSK